MPVAQSPRPTLVLLPGMDGTGELFAPLLAALDLAISVTVVRYPDRAATYDEHAAVARAELPRDRPFVLLGESFSGPVAVSLAASAPPNLVGLILCASFLTCPSAALRLFRALTPLATPKLVPPFLAHRQLLGRFATAELRAAHEHALGHVASRTLTARLRAIADVDVREAMRRVTVPTLYLRATEDRVVPQRAGREVLELAPLTRVVDIEAPHFLLQARPREAARAIEEFLNSRTS